VQLAAAHVTVARVMIAKATAKVALKTMTQAL